MSGFKTGLLGLLLLSLAAQVQAQGLSTATLASANTPGIVGTWRLLSYEIEVQSSGAKEAVFGAQPTGYAHFSPAGRVMFILTADGRQAAQTSEQSAALLASLVAYSGRYRIEADKWITQVDVAWNPAWVGTEQSRQFLISGNRLQVLTPWRVMPNWAAKGQTRSIVSFERVAE